MTPTCRTCKHFHPWRNDDLPGPNDVGECDLGGPTPEEGSSDVGEEETCGKWEGRDGLPTRAPS